MIEPLSGMPEGVIGFEAVGEVHSADYVEVLVPAIEQAATSGGIRLVYVFGERFEGYSSGASWQDAKLGMHHVHAWKRLAVVTDVDWVRHLVSVFGWMVPGDVRHFSLAERDDAVAWAAAG
jgi:hypothetical protein